MVGNLIDDGRWKRVNHKEEQHDILARVSGTLFALHHDCGSRGGLMDSGHKFANTAEIDELKSTYDGANYATSNNASASDNIYCESIHRNDSDGSYKNYRA
ncbi:hypothetical protein MRX96_026700 [Rhipicephalus microplus]